MAGEKSRIIGSIDGAITSIELALSTLEREIGNIPTIPRMGGQGDHIRRVQWVENTLGAPLQDLFDAFHQLSGSTREIERYYDNTSKLKMGARGKARIARDNARARIEIYGPRIEAILRRLREFDFSGNSGRLVREFIMDFFD